MSVAIENIINEDYIKKILGSNPSKDQVDQILKKALSLHGLSLEESAMLFNVEDKDLLEEIYKSAKIVKEEVYGKRIVLFAPMYVSNYCTNNCKYCGFRADNKDVKRIKLSPEQTIEETKEIIKMGHKRLLLVAGEDLKTFTLDETGELIKKIYETTVDNGVIRRVNVNIAPLSVPDFKKLASFNIGTFQCFQETYNKELYKEMHPSGLKANYDYRLTCMDRAIEAGIQDFGMGALFGLGDYKFEALGLLQHSHYLNKKYGVGPHTLSVPRIEAAEGASMTTDSKYHIKDEQFKKIIAILRLSVPYTGMILTTRETPAFRKECVALGISQVSAGSKTEPGGYTNKDAVCQFEVADHRCLDEVVYSLCELGYVPSFCTSCYRRGRVGSDFMPLAKAATIKYLCLPNALSTFTEYLEDYASEKTKKIGAKVIEKHLKEIKDEKILATITGYLERLHNGERDLFL